MEGSFASLNCLRADRFQKGSSVSPALPAATPVHLSHPLSGAAKAGIAVGVVLAVVLIAVAVWFFLVRQKRRRRMAAGARGDRKDGEENDDTGFAKLVGKEKYEMGGDHMYGQELKGTAVSEADSQVPEELEGHAHHHGREPAELYG